MTPFLRHHKVSKIHGDSESKWALQRSSLPKIFANLRAVPNRCEAADDCSQGENEEFLCKRSKDQTIGRFRITCTHDKAWKWFGVQRKCDRLVDRLQKVKTRQQSRRCKRCGLKWRPGKTWIFWKLQEATKIIALIVIWLASQALSC